jgi:hypothetical protein
LTFDEGGHFRFDISPDRVELTAALRFLSNLMASLGYSGSGVTIAFLPLPAIGVESRLDLPLPDVSFGAFGISNLRLLSGFGLRVAEGNFTVAASVGVGRKSAPFNLSVFILGGGGWVEVDAVYTPATQSITTDVSVGITASACLAISLGPIRGSVSVSFGIFLEFHSRQSAGLTIGIVLIFAGEVCLASIVSVSIRLRLEATYNTDGTVIGRGIFTAKIKICWCFTLSISKRVEYTLKEGKSRQARGLAAPTPVAMKALAGPDGAGAVFVADPYEIAAAAYVDMIS